MNKYIDQLCAAAAKESRVILGMMSGTSLDGLDLALCRIYYHGLQTKVELLHHRTCLILKPKNMIREVAFKPEATLDKICLLHAWVADVHAGMVIEALQDWQFRFHQLIFLPATAKQFSMHPIIAGDLVNLYTAPCKWAMATGFAVKPALSASVISGKNI